MKKLILGVFLLSGSESIQPSSSLYKFTQVLSPNDSSSLESNDLRLRHSPLFELLDMETSPKIPYEFVKVSSADSSLLLTGLLHKTLASQSGISEFHTSFGHGNSSEELSEQEDHEMSSYNMETFLEPYRNVLCRSALYHSPKPKNIGGKKN